MVLAAVQEKDNISSLLLILMYETANWRKTKECFHRVACTLIILGTSNNCMYNVIKLRIERRELKSWNRTSRSVESMLNQKLDPDLKFSNVISLAPQQA